MKLNQQRCRIENRGFFIVTRNVNNTFFLITDIKDEHSGVDEFPDWLFPFAEAEITSFSSFAVVWRLKSFTFKNPSTLSSSFPCILSDHPGVSVTFPESSLPTGQTFALTVKVVVHYFYQNIY